ncbi:hypothetical protein FIU87_17675 [Bacillus sp. THAF10]|uniref:DUF11 domain-containing protein n=1 Tax=Bacillus sp. THAF10 TaxID=2587848 RepID=UPI001269736A|nr:DUF11 domain-containing protein [Bacillus sp. THAF10]QFT90475.1 hypothetical protein FIU87_17675 [Bacillus sp. THAF10]
MPFVNRFSIADCGAMTFTGNTLGLSGDGVDNEAGTTGTIGAFITLDSSSTVDAFPPPVPPGSAGTTTDYTQNGSEAQLVIPSGSTVLYAELIWGGLFSFDTQDISNLIDNDILFTTPALIDVSISPDAATSNQFTVGTTGFYMRSANVTALVQAGGAGTYSAESVPALIFPPISQTFHAGWTLAVVYSNGNLPNRSMNLFVGAENIVFTTQPQIDVNVTGFLTPATGDVDARVLLSAQEGDAEITGDETLFGPDNLTLTNLSGPLNPATNFYGSQITDDSGNLDTSGSYGTFNQIPGTPGTNVLAGRQGWDITNVSAFNYLPNGQTSAVLRFTSSGDAYMPNGIGIQIDLGDPVMDMVKEVNKTFSYTGDVLTYTVSITNNGVVEATDVFFEDDLPSGGAFIPDTVRINGIVQPGLDPEVGFSINSIQVDETVTVSFKARVVTSSCFLLNDAQVTFSCGKVATSNQVLTTVCQHCSNNKNQCSC